MTNDLEEARQFCGGLFDWSFDIGPEQMGSYTMCRSHGRNAAGMGKMPADAPFPPSWNVYFSVESVDDTLAKIKEAGGQLIVEPMDIPLAGRMAFCVDPTGAAFGLWQPREHKGAAVVDEPGSMTWCEVNTRSGENARDFYATVFGLDPHKMEGMDYWTLHTGDKTAAGVMQMDARWPAEVPPHWMAYFAVVDADTSANKVIELGGTVKVPPFDTPYGRICVVSDPSGAVFSILALNPNRPQ